MNSLTVHASLSELTREDDQLYALGGTLRNEGTLADAGQYRVFLAPRFAAPFDYWFGPETTSPIAHEAPDDSAHQCASTIVAEHATTELEQLRREVRHFIQTRDQQMLVQLNEITNCEWGEDAQKVADLERALTSLLRAIDDAEATQETELRWFHKCIEKQNMGPFMRKYRRCSIPLQLKLAIVDVLRTEADAEIKRNLSRFISQRASLFVDVLLATSVASGPTFDQKLYAALRASKPLNC